MEPTTAAPSRVSLLRSVLGTFGVLASHGFAGAVVIVILTGVVQHYIAIFADRDAELPSITFTFIRLSNWLTAYWYLLVLLLVPDALVSFGLSRLARKWNWLATAWTMLWLLATIGLLFMLTLAMYLPVEGLLARPKGP